MSSAFDSHAFHAGFRAVRFFEVHNFPVPIVITPQVTRGGGGGARVLIFGQIFLADFLFSPISPRNFLILQGKFFEKKNRTHQPQLILL